MKKIISILLAISVVLCGFTVFADEPGQNDKIISEVYLYTGKLFYCDSPTDRAVIKNITPVIASPGGDTIAAEAEYLEIKLAHDGIRMSDNTKITPADMNMYADSEVRFVLAKSADGNLFIPFLRFL